MLGNAKLPSSQIIFTITSPQQTQKSKSIRKKTLLMHHYEHLIRSLLRLLILNKPCNQSFTSNNIKLWCFVRYQQSITTLTTLCARARALIRHRFQFWKQLDCENGFSTPFITRNNSWPWNQIPTLLLLPAVWDWWKLKRK